MSTPTCPRHWYMLISVEPFIPIFDSDCLQSSSSEDEGVFVPLHYHDVLGLPADPAASISCLALISPKVLRGKRRNVSLASRSQSSLPPHCAAYRHPQNTPTLSYPCAVGTQYPNATRTRSPDSHFHASFVYSGLSHPPFEVSG